MTEVEVLSVYIHEATKDYTLSNFSVMGQPAGVGIEDADGDDNKDGVLSTAEKEYGITRIPRGKYEIELSFSPKFSWEYYRDDDGNLIAAAKRTTADLKKKYHTPHELVHVLGVPGFLRILWHWGNTVLDTLGCYIVGTRFGWRNKKRAVLESRAKYTQAYPLIFRAIRDAKKEGLKPMVIYSN